MTLDRPLSLGCQRDILKFPFSRLDVLLDNHGLLEMFLIMMPGRLTYISLILVPHCGRRFWYQGLCLLVSVVSVLCLFLIPNMGSLCVCGVEWLAVLDCFFSLPVKEIIDL